MSAKALEVFCLDNHDSFVFNLADEFARRGCRVETWRNSTSLDRACDRIDSLERPRLLLLSPGPGRPETAGCLLSLIERMVGRIPIFGVCLGHQAIVQAYGGQIDAVGEIVHGKVSPVEHDGTGLFEDCPTPMTVARYHSLGTRAVPSSLEVIGKGPGPAGSVLPMAVEDPHMAVAGVQFHPESILSPHGGRIIDNVINMARKCA